MYPASNSKLSSFLSSLDIIVFIAGLLFSLLLWKATTSISNNYQQIRLDAQTDALEHQLNFEVDKYNTLFTGFIGLYQASNDVLPMEFNRYAQVQDLPNVYPGLQSISFISSQEIYESENDSIRAEALVAREQNAPIATKTLPVGSGGESGFILIYPVFKNKVALQGIEEKDADIVGYLKASFEYDKFFKLILTKEMVNSNIFEVTDGDETIFKINMDKADVTSKYSRFRMIEVAQKRYKLHMFPPTGQAQGIEGSLPLIFLGTGIIITLLLFGMTYSLSSSQARAQYTANAMTVKLRESEERFKIYMDNTSVVAWLKDPKTWKYVYINKHFEENFSVTSEKALQKTDFDLFPEENAQELRKNDIAVVEQNKLIESYENVPSSDGQNHVWLVYKFPVVLSNKTVLIGGTAIDVTNEKKNQGELEKQKQELERLNGLMIGRELKMVSLKKENQELRDEIAKKKNP